MKILVVGGGGREHALVWKLHQSPRVQKIYCAPGNGGIAELAECVHIDPEDIPKLVAFAQSEGIDLTIVGPEGPLSMGIVDRFEEKGLRIFGASEQAAEIESSKSFAKSLMQKYGIPTAQGKTFTGYQEAAAYLKEIGRPVVVKADGLAAGKGVIVCRTEAEAENALHRIMVDREFGTAGDQVLIEDCLTGEEASFLAFTDGKTVLPLPSSQDHKPVFDDDQGPNTGGMGAYSPAPIIDRHLHQKIMKEIMIPTVQGMAAEGRPYKGVLYAGLMIERGRPRVLEFNGRFGDPEAQPLLMRLKSDLVPVIEAVIDEKLHTCRLEIDPRATVCVVMAAGGYPGSYEKGKPISGLDAVRDNKNVVVFHAGTQASDNRTLTSGGRVLGVTAIDDSVDKAIDTAYRAVAQIDWPEVHYRKDIGRKALKRFGTAPKVGIVMGSDSDLEVMEGAVEMLKHFDIPYVMTVASAHRSPKRAMDFAEGAKARGMEVIIAGAGHAAHLAGVLAAHTPLPVIGVPIDSSCLKGWDALLSTVQMPPGIPVATVSIGKSGAKNAGILAAQILALSNPEIADMLTAYKAELARQVEKKARKLDQPL